MLKNLSHMELLNYVNIKKDDELKMMSITGITIGAIILLLINILVSSINDIPSIVTIYNWPNKLLIILTLLYNAIISLLLFHHLFFGGNNKELSKNYQTNKVLINKKKNEIIRANKPDFKKLKDILLVVSTNKNEIDKNALAMGKFISLVAIISFLFLNAYTSYSYLLKINKMYLFVNLIFVLSFLIASIFPRTKLYNIGALCSTILSLLLIIITLYNYDMKSFLYNFILIKYSGIICLIIIGLSVVSIFTSRVYTYKWLANFVDQIYLEEITDEEIVNKIEGIYLTRTKIGFFNRGDIK